MANRIHVLTKDFLNEQYTILGKSIIEIHNDIGISCPTISKAMNKYGIPKRTTGSRLGKVNKGIYKFNDSINIGDKFGLLTVQESVKGGYLCLCDCGNIKILGTGRLLRDGQKSCSHKCKSTTGAKHFLFKGVKNVSQSLFKHYYKHAVDRNLTFDVTIDELSELFDKQNQLCAISKQPIIMKKSGNDKTGTASLDRIDSSKPYTIDNVQWLHKTVNTMKWNLNQQDFINFCKTIASVN